MTEMLLLTLPCSLVSFLDILTDFIYANYLPKPSIRTPELCSLDIDIYLTETATS